jgi:ferritin
MKFFDHIIDRGGTATLLDLKQLKTSWSSPLEAWKDACDHEKFITGKIHGILNRVRAENDYTAEPLLAWFVNEQIEEEANTEKILRQMERIGDSREGLFMLDRELGTRIFPPGSPLDPAAYNAAT